MKKSLLTFALLSSAAMSQVFAHGILSPHQSYSVNKEAKVVVISIEVINQRTDIDQFSVVVRDAETGEGVAFASPTRTFNQKLMDPPKKLTVLVKNDSQLPRSLRVCTISAGKKIDSSMLATEVCSLINIRQSKDN